MPKPALPEMPVGKTADVDREIEGSVVEGGILPGGVHDSGESEWNDEE